MRKEYKIIKNFESANTETSYFGKYDKEGKTRINPTEPFYQTIAYSRRLFYSEDYISHAGFINSELLPTFRRGSFLGSICFC